MRDRGSKIDLLNLQWIYRAKKYYNMKPADIYLLLMPDPLQTLHRSGQGDGRCTGTGRI